MRAVILFHTHSVTPSPSLPGLFPHCMLTAVDSGLRYLSFAMVKWIKNISTFFLYAARLSFSPVLHDNIAYPFTRFTSISFCWLSIKMLQALHTGYRSRGMWLLLKEAQLLQHHGDACSFWEGMLTHPCESVSELLCELSCGSFYQGLIGYIVIILE